MNTDNEIRNILRANPKPAIDFVLANPEEFLAFLNKQEVDLLEEMFITEGEEPEPELPENIKALEKAYEEADDVNIKDYVTDSRMKEINTIHKPNFIDRLAEAIMDGTLDKDYTTNLFTRIGV